MPDRRCATCAFRPGTEASRSELTLVKAQLCLISGTVFHCHEAPGWEPCAGYLAALPAHQNEPEWRQDFALEMLDLIEEAERAGSGWTEQRTIEFIRAAVDRVDVRHGGAAGSLSTGGGERGLQGGGRHG